MNTINSIPSSAHALAPTSPIPATLIEDSAETLSELSLEELQERNFKRLALLFSTAWIIEKKALGQKEPLLEEHRLSETNLPPKYPEIPLEIVGLIFYHTLLNLEPHEIIGVTQFNVQLPKVKWLALYQKFDWLYPEIVSTLSEFRTLVKDACTYGQKTFEQIFSGFHLLKRIKENPDALLGITLADLEQAGIYTDKSFLPPNSPTREIASREFLAWIHADPACILVCLRWVPAQNSIPNLLAIVANYDNLTIVKTVFTSIKERHITDFDAEQDFNKKRALALENAIIKANTLMADYFVNTVGISIEHLPRNILHKAVTAGSFKMVEWLVKKGGPLHHTGSNPIQHYYYGKTAADLAISQLTLWNFVVSPSPEGKKNRMNRLHIALYLIDKGIQFNPQYQPKNMTLLHAACYAEDVDLGLRVARLMIEKDPGCIHTPTQDRNAFTPLHIAFKERKYRLMELLLEHGADATIPIQEDTISNERAKKRSVIKLAYQSDDLDAQEILQKTGNTDIPCQYNFDWVHPEWVSKWEEFQALIGDAGKYGQRTPKQIFEGLNILRLIKLAGSHAPITIAHLQRAGIVQKGSLYPNDIEANEQAQNAFVDWIRDHPAHMLAFLRWVPVQRNIPNLCKQDITSPLHAEKALKRAVKNADLPIAHYLLDKASIRRLPVNILHIAAETGCLKMVELLIDHGVLLGKKGRSQDNQNSYRGKTAAEVAVSAMAASYFSPNAPQAIREHGVNLLSTARYLLQKGQEQDILFDPTYTPTGMTLLHAACYVSSEQEGHWLAQFAFDQNPTYIHEVDSAGRTPLHRAIQQKRPLLIDFLINNDAQIKLTPLAYIALKRNDPHIFSLLKSKKKAVSIRIMDPSLIPTLNFHYILNRIRAILISMWPQWSSLRRPNTLYLAFFREYLTRLQRPRLIAQTERANSAHTVSTPPLFSASASRTDAQSPPDDAQTVETPIYERYFRGVSLNAFNALSTKGARLIPAVKTRIQSLAPLIGYQHLANDPISSSMHSLDENTPPE